MGKASRRKREHRSTGRRGLTRQDAIERVLGSFVAVTETGAVVTESSAAGGILECFSTPGDARTNAAEAGVEDAEAEALESAADLLDLLGAAGATCVRLEDNSTVKAGCTLDTLVGDFPTVLFVGSFERPQRYMTRAGVIEDWPKSRQLYPWRRWDLIDRGIFSLPPCSLSEADSWWELAGDDTAALFAERNVFGPFPSLFGAVLFFSSRERAEHYNAALPAGATASIHLGPHAGSQLKPRRVDSLYDRLREILPGSGASTPVILDPGGPRHETAFGTVGSPAFRTVSSIWLLESPSVFKCDRDWHSFSGTDTFHWRGGSTSNTASAARSHGQVAQHDDIATDRTFLDSFLVVLEERYDPAASTWLLSGTVVSALAALSEHQRTDLQARLRSTAQLPWLVVPADSPRCEQARSRDFERFVAETVTEIRDRGYRPIDAEAIAAAANEVMQMSRVRAIGWVRDLLIASRDVPDLVDDLLDMAGDERADLLRWIEDSNVLPVAAEARDALVRALGADAWAALDPRSRRFLGTAWLHLHEHGERDDLDHSNVVIMCGKATEVELAELIGSFRQTERWRCAHNEDDSNDKLLRGFLDGTAKLTLGSGPYLLRPKESDSELRAALKDHLSGLALGDVLTGRNFSKKLTSLSKARNPASHDTSTEASVAHSTWEKVVGQDGILQALVAWKATGEPREPVGAVLSPAPFPFRVTVHGSVAERYVPRFSDDVGLAPRTLFEHIPEVDFHDEGHRGTLGEHVDWMVQSGLLDEMAANGEVGDSVVEMVRSVHEMWQQTSLIPPPANSSLMKRLSHKILFEPDSLGKDRVVDERTGEVYWPLVPGAALAFERRGIVVLMARSAPSEDDAAIETFEMACDDQTVVSLDEWLKGNRSTIWRHRRDSFVVQSHESKDASSTLRIVLRRSRPPGGHFPIQLDPEASALLSQAVSELASGEWGRLATATQPGRSISRG